MRQRWDVWKKLQAGAAVLAVAVLLTSPDFWDAAAKPDEADFNPVLMLLFAPVLAAACVFAVSHIVELIVADVRLWRAKRRDKRPKAGLAEILPPSGVGDGPLLEQRSRDVGQITERPTHREPH